MKEQQLALLCRVGRMVNSTLDLEEVLSSAVRAAVEATGAERGMVLLLDEHGAPRISADEGVDPETAQDAERISRGILEQASRSGEPVITLDARMDPRFSDRESVRIYGIRSVMCVPLRVRDRTIGMVYLDHRGAGGVFHPDDGPFYRALADQLALAVENARLHEQLKQEVVHLREEVGAQYRFDRILGKSKRMREVFRTLEQVIPTSVTVLLRGESGTGKELVARAIHYNGPRKEKRFVAQNCAALPESLLESELFGYRKGAFTGAAQDKKGLFEVADGGTLFLDEIVDMSPGLQSRLLRVLEEGCIRRLGETEPRPVDVRVISATNRDLEKELKEGRFRKDLYYRLNVVGIELPPLRERIEDIPLLAAHFLKRFSKEMDKPIQGFRRDAMDRLLTYPWPGNVRELEHMVERAVVLGRGDVVRVEDLPGPLRGETSTLLDVGIPEGRSFQEAKAEFEKAFLERVLRTHRGNITRAAQVVGLDRANLYGKIRKHGINVEGMRREDVKRET